MVLTYTEYLGKEHTTTSVSAINPRFAQPYTTANDTTGKLEHTTNSVPTGRNNIAIGPIITFPLFKIRLACKTALRLRKILKGKLQ